MGSPTSPSCLPIELVHEVFELACRSVPLLHTDRCCELGTSLRATQPRLVHEPDPYNFNVPFTRADIINCSLLCRHIRRIALPHLFHRITVNSVSRLFELATLLDSLVVQISTRPSGIGILSSLELVHDMGEVSWASAVNPISDAIEVEQQWSPIERLILPTVTDISLIIHGAIVQVPYDVFDEDIPDGECGAWGWVAVPTAFRRLIEAAAAKPVHGPLAAGRPLRSLSLRNLAPNPGWSHHYVWSPTLHHVELTSDRWNTSFAMADPSEPRTPQWMQAYAAELGAGPGPQGVIEYDLRTLKLDVSVDCDALDHLLDPQTATCPALHTLDFVAIDGHPGHAPKTMLTKAHMPNLSTMRLPSYRGAVILSPLIHLVKNLEFERYLGEGVSDLEAPDGISIAATISWARWSRSVDDQHLTDCFADPSRYSNPPGGATVSPESVVSLRSVTICFHSGLAPCYRPAPWNAEQWEFAQRYKRYTESLARTVSYPDLEAYLSDIEKAVDWKQLGELQRRREDFPNWNRIVVDVRKVCGVCHGWDRVLGERVRVWLGCTTESDSLRVEIANGA